MVPVLSFVMPAKAGTQGATDTAPEALGPRFREGDEEEKIGLVCLVRTTIDARDAGRLGTLPPDDRAAVRSYLRQQFSGLG